MCLATRVTLNETLVMLTAIEVSLLHIIRAGGIFDHCCRIDLGRRPILARLRMREPLALVGYWNQAAVEALIQAIQRDVSDREGDLALVIARWSNLKMLIDS